MNSFFITNLTDFLNTNIEKHLSIQNVNIWQKNKTIKITLIIKKKNAFANLEECIGVHRLIKIWGKKENLQDRLQIEVQSESIDKKLIHLSDFEENLNKLIQIELKEKIDNKRHFKGFLIEVKDDMVLLRAQDNDHVLNFHEIKKAKIIPEI